jgi:hypothetical protein
LEHRPSAGLTFKCKLDELITSFVPVTATKLGSYILKNDFVRLVDERRLHSHMLNSDEQQQTDVYKYKKFCLIHRRCSSRNDNSWFAGAGTCLLQSI